MKKLRFAGFRKVGEVFKFWSGNVERLVFHVKEEIV